MGRRSGCSLRLEWRLGDGYLDRRGTMRTSIGGAVAKVWVGRIYSSKVEDERLCGGAFMEVGIGSKVAARVETMVCEHYISVVKVQQ